MKPIFEFKGYKTFLIHYENSRKHVERGFRSKLAEHIGCQSGYVSHVLNGNSHFSLEQAWRIADFLNLTEKERKFLLLLVEYERAGSKELSDHFETELTLAREAHLNIKERVGSSRSLTESEQMTYYSSWYYVAVHVLSSLPSYGDLKTIAQALSIPENVVSEVLVFLIQTGIVIESRGKLKPGLTQIHLKRDSSFIRQHHTNCRMAAIQSIAMGKKTDIHYSTLSTLSKVDAEILRSEMVALIEKYVAAVQPSREEVMYGFNLDFFDVIKG